MFLDREREVYMYILLLSTVLCTLFLFFICNKKTTATQEIHDNYVSKTLKEIGNNEKLAKELLKYIGNTTTTVETNQDKKIKASFYDSNTDKITIKNTEDLEECSRLIHISHECIHSIQDKKILKLHFLLSNIQILYFLGIFIYFFYNKNLELRMNLLLVQLFIFVLTFFVKIVLESDATYRSTVLAFNFLESKLKSNEIASFKKDVEEKLYPIIPLSYFSLYLQGATLLLIAQAGAIFIS